MTPMTKDTYHYPFFYIWALLPATLISNKKENDLAHNSKIYSNYFVVVYYKPPTDFQKLAKFKHFCLLYFCKFNVSYDFTCTQPAGNKLHWLKILRKRPFFWSWGTAPCRSWSQIKTIGHAAIKDILTIHVKSSISHNLTCFKSRRKQWQRWK